MKRKPQITIPKKKIEKFCRSYHISKLALFGSVLTDQFTATSDIDILVEFEPKHIPGLFGIVGMENELTKIQGRKADLRTPQDLSRYFRQDVLTKAYPIYGQGQFRSNYTSEH